MSNTHHSPQRPAGGPYVVHLDRLCQLIEMGQTFNVELHPYGRIPRQLQGTVIGHIGIHIMDGGEVALQAIDGSTSTMLGLTLANYKKAWRVWVGGMPTDAARRALKWG